MKMDRYIVFDVETPNHLCDRISGIGIAVIENGRIIETIDTLVDPEEQFDYFNVALTGITPEMVEGKPNFAELWDEIGELMNSGILVAHNAPFDMRVLAKCLDAYEIDWKRYADYACTCTMGRACYPELENHKLNTMCYYLNIELDHHKAGSDSIACADLLLNYLEKGFDIKPYLRKYDLYLQKTLPAGSKNSRKKDK